MTNFPYIKWSQTSKQIIIEFLHKSSNFNAEKKDNKLMFKDDNFDVLLDLSNDFNIDNIIENPKTIKLILNKIDEIKWSKLLKDEKKYKFYISTDWDKFIVDELEPETTMDMNNMMQGFDPSMFNSEQLKDLMSANMGNEPVDEETVDEEIVNEEKVDDANIENSISNLDIN